MNSEEYHPIIIPAINSPRTVKRKHNTSEIYIHTSTSPRLPNGTAPSSL